MAEEVLMRPAMRSLLWYALGGLLAVVLWLLIYRLKP
jgi:hypothetical protein